MAKNTRDIDSAHIDFTQGVRQTIIANLTQDEKILSGDGDPDKIDLLTKLLGDMDRAALGRLRITVDDDANQDKALARQMVAEILSTLDPNSKRIEGAKNIAASALEGDALGQREYVEGEMNIGEDGLTYEVFQEEQRKHITGQTD